MSEYILKSLHILTSAPYLQALNVVFDRVRISLSNQRHSVRRHVACGIQETLSTKANQHLTFGHFEKAIVHFHQNLAKHLEEKNS